MPESFLRHLFFRADRLSADEHTLSVIVHKKETRPNYQSEIQLIMLMARRWHIHMQ